MAKNKFSKDWIHQHINDPYVKMAQQKGYRARAAFKLIEILDTEKLLRRGDLVVDLGSAPGSWSQVARERLAGPGGVVDGRIIALDMLPMEPVAGVEFIQGDFREDDILKQLEDMVGSRAVDLVISDMAPNMSGTSADQPRAIYLCELALDMAVRVLKPGGAFVVKVFQGEGYEAYRRQVQEHFKLLRSRKPQASRPRSPEVYLVGEGFKG